MAKRAPTLAATPATSQFQGGLVALTRGGTLIGWALNRDDLQQMLWVEILGDGDVLELVCANTVVNSHDDAIPADACQHVFLITLGDQRLSNVGVLEARVANTHQRLTGRYFPHQIVRQAKRQRLIGQVENHGGLKLWGWAFDPNHPDQTLQLRLYHHAELIAVIKADQRTPQFSLDATEIAGHGFQYTLPSRFADGQTHEITLITEAGQALTGSPLTVFVPQKGLNAWLTAQSADSRDHNLLDYLADRYQRYVPLSVGFDAYFQWQRLFIAPTPATADPSQTPFLLLIQGSVDLSQTLDSLLGQTHPHWQALCLPHDQEIPKVGSEDPRIQIIGADDWPAKLGAHRAIDGSLLIALSAGDTLTPDALAVFAQAFADPNTQLAYSDCDIRQPDGTCQPWLKPDWDPDYALHQPLLSPGFVMRSRLLEQPLAADEDWTWPCHHAIRTTPGSVQHIPRILVRHPQPGDHARYITQRNRWLQQNPAIGLAEGDRIHWPAPAEWPQVSLIIPTRDRADLLKICIDSLLATDYPALELIVVDNDSQDADTQRYLRQLSQQGVRVIPHPGTFNFAAMNNRAAALATGSVLGLINNDIEALHPGWLKEMVRTLLRPDVVAVGAKLLWPNGMVQHGGVLLGLHGLAGHIGNDWHDDDPGYFGLNQAIRSVSAVTAACLLCRTEDYLAIGGLDAQAFPVNFNDVDFCLRLRQGGRRIVWTPHARLCHAESASRGRDESPARRARADREKALLMQRWRPLIDNDPCYNPQLNLDRYSHAGLALPPRGKPFCSPFGSALGKTQDMQRQDRVAAAGQGTAEKTTATARIGCTPQPRPVARQPASPRRQTSKTA